MSVETISPGKGVTVALWSIAVMLGLSLVVLVSAVADAGPWDPIGDFPVQTVVEVDVDAVTIDGVKCYDERVEVIGSFWWQSVNPPGAIAGTASGAAERDAGCHEFRFVNPVPLEVLELDGVLGGAEWIITGIETPIDASGGREGLPHSWRSEPFRLAAVG